MGAAGRLETSRAVGRIISVPLPGVISSKRSCDPNGKSPCSYAQYPRAPTATPSRKRNMPLVEASVVPAARHSPAGDSAASGSGQCCAPDRLRAWQVRRDVLLPSARAAHAAQGDDETARFGTHDRAAAASAAMNTTDWGAVLLGAAGGLATKGEGHWSGDPNGGWRVLAPRTRGPKVGHKFVINSAGSPFSVQTFFWAAYVSPKTPHPCRSGARALQH